MLNIRVAALILLVFTCAAWGTTEKILYVFSGPDGEFPEGGVIVIKKGLLVGVTSSGGGFSNCCGTVFSLFHEGDAWTESVLYTFGGNYDGRGPSGPVTLSHKGQVFGTTKGGGGVHSNGTAFILYRSGGKTIERVFPFRDEVNGKAPNAPVVFDSAGNLYGTTSDGGTNGGGVIYQITPPHLETILHNFPAQTACLGGLTIDAAGNLYGMTAGGGDFGYGTVFRLSHSGNGWEYSVLHSFTAGVDGGSPWSGNLIFDDSGNLYGTTVSGGTPCPIDPTGCGTVFELTPNPDDTWTETVLYSFVGDSDGAYPTYGVAMDAAGNLYGTTSLGGISGEQGLGTVFRLTRLEDGSWKETVLHSFGNGLDGYYPDSSVAIDGKGNLYGTTYNSGRGYGAVFQVQP